MPNMDDKDLGQEQMWGEKSWSSVLGQSVRCLQGF